LGAQEEEVKGLRRLIESLEEQLSERTRWLQVQSQTLDALHEEVEMLKRKNAGGGEGTGD
jgi:nitrate/nitrite-specific signal transduction histidine kinase